MKLTYIVKADAQARADRLHADMIASSTLYAESAALYDAKQPERGGTARWCFPDAVNGNWGVTVDERVISVLTAQECVLAGIIEAIPIEEEPLP